MSKIINKFKFPNDNNEYQINAAQLEGKTLEEIKQEVGSGEIPAHKHTYTPAGTINESVIEEVIAHSKAIDDIVTLPSLSVTHIEDDNALSFSWSAGDLTQDNVVTEIEANPIQPTFTGELGETTGTSSNTPTNNSGTIVNSLGDEFTSLNIEGYSYVQIVLYACNITANSFGLRLDFGESSWTYDDIFFNLNNNLTIEVINQRLLRITSKDQGLIQITRVDYPRSSLLLKPYSNDSRYTSSESMSFEYFMIK